MFAAIRSSRLMALVVAYAGTALLLGAVVAWQSGPEPAAIALFTNLVLAVGPIGCVWAGGHLAERAGVRRWLPRRLVGDAVGLIATFTLLYFGLNALEWLMPGPRAGWVGPEAFLDPMLGAAVFLTAVNVVPLGVALGLEAAAGARS